MYVSGPYLRTQLWYQFDPSLGQECNKILIQESFRITIVYKTNNFFNENINWIWGEQAELFILSCGKKHSPSGLFLTLSVKVHTLDLHGLVVSFPILKHNMIYK